VKLPTDLYLVGSYCSNTVRYFIWMGIKGYETGAPPVKLGRRVLGGQVNSVTQDWHILLIEMQKFVTQDWHILLIEMQKFDLKRFSV
jgi:hypothetical protein